MCSLIPQCIRTYEYMLYKYLTIIQVLLQQFGLIQFNLVMYTQAYIYLYDKEMLH